MSRFSPRLASLCLLTALAAVASGCVATIVTEPTNLPAGAPTAAPGDRAPIIAALDYSPKTGLTVNDFISFTVVANDPEGQPLQYNWSSTRGTLTANTGLTASWRPAKADGSFDPGLTAVTVMVSDGRHTTTGTVNVMIDAQGAVTVQQPELPPASAAPSATPTPAPSPSDDGAVSGRVLFEEGFEGGLDQWEIASTFIGANWNTLTWKSSVEGAQAGKAAAVLNDGDDEVKADTKQDTIWIQHKAPLDLTEAKLPRLRLYVKSAAVPANTVKFQVFVSPQRWGSGMVPTQYFVGTAFQGGKDWTKKDIDLSSLKGQAGYLAIAVEVQGNGSVFKGPMVDSITVYDAGQ